VIFKTFKNLIKDKEKLIKERSLISYTTIKKIKKLQGRLFY